MSHFSVAVITDGLPGEDGLAAALQPYHQFECTGTDDQYVSDVDDTEMLRKQYAERLKPQLKAPDGSRHDPYENRFYRDPTTQEIEKHKPMVGTGFAAGLSWTSKDWGDGRGYRAKVHFIPEGWREVSIPVHEMQSFAAFVADWTGREAVPFGTKPDLSTTHKYGYTLLDADGNVSKIVRRTNEAAEWDWWVLGGRYMGRLILKVGHEQAGRSGRPGTFDNEPTHRNGVDSALVRDIDLKFMRAENVKQARRAIDDKVTEIARKHSLLRGDVLANHAAYCEQLMIMRMLWEERGKGGAFYQFLDADPEAETYRRLRDIDGGCLTDRYLGVGCPENEPDPYAWADGLPPLSAFAYLKDGKWHEKGEMGWWGVVHGAKDEHDWDREFQSMLDGLSPDHAISIVDCHI